LIASAVSRPGSRSVPQAAPLIFFTRTGTPTGRVVITSIISSSEQLEKSAMLPSRFLLQKRCDFADDPVEPPISQATLRIMQSALIRVGGRRPATF
jgi:hypothetical protein